MSLSLGCEWYTGDHHERMGLMKTNEVPPCEDIDTEGIRTLAGRAQWISSPSP